MNNLMRQRTLSLLVFALCLCGPSWLSAQEKAPTTFSDSPGKKTPKAFDEAQQPPPIARISGSQSRELSRAVEFARAKEYEAALEIYNQLVQELDLNLLHLNRGRVLQKLGQCQEAAAAFKRVPNAPRDPAIAFESIQSSLLRYTETLENSCAGTLVVSCEDPQGSFRLDNGPEVACGSPLNVEKPGKYTVSANFYGQTIAKDVHIRGTRRNSALLTFSRAQLIAAGRYLLGHKDYANATLLFERAMRGGPGTQDLHLYIAEALIGQERCQSASLALKDAPGAPPSSELSPIESARRVEDLRLALSRTCGEQVLITCNPADLTLRIDKGAPQVCSPAPIFLHAGEHTIEGTVQGEPGEEDVRLTRKIEVTQGTVHRVEMTLVRDGLGPMGTWGIVSASVGTAAILGAIVLDLTYLSAEIDEYKTINNLYRDHNHIRETRDEVKNLQLLNQGLLTAGGALVITGGVLVLTDLWDEDQKRSGTLTIDIDEDKGTTLSYQGVW